MATTISLHCHTMWRLLFTVVGSHVLVLTSTELQREGRRRLLLNLRSPGVTLIQINPETATDYFAECRQQ